MRISHPLKVTFPYIWYMRFLLVLNLTGDDKFTEIEEFYNVADLDLTHIPRLVILKIIIYFLHISPATMSHLVICITYSCMFLLNNFPSFSTVVMPPYDTDYTLLLIGGPETVSGYLFCIYSVWHEVCERKARLCLSRSKSRIVLLTLTADLFPFWLTLYFLTQTKKKNNIDTKWSLEQGIPWGLSSFI